MHFLKKLDFWESIKILIACSKSGVLVNVLPDRKWSRCLKRWKSVGDKSGEYGGCCKISNPSSFSVITVNRDVCGLALSCSRIGPWRFTSAGRCIFNFSWISWIYSQYVSAVIVLLTGNKKYLIIPWTPHQTVSKVLRGWSGAFGQCFGASSLSSHLDDLLQLTYETHFSSQVTILSRKDSFLWRVRCSEYAVNRSNWFFSVN